MSVLSPKAAEARWASSVLYSCAVQLQQCGAAALATELLIAACDGAALSIAQEVCLEPEQQHHKGQVRAWNHTPFFHKSNGCRQANECQASNAPFFMASDMSWHSDIMLYMANNSKTLLFMLYSIQLLAPERLS